MASLRYIQITSQEPIACVDVVTQIHYLLTPGEAPNPNATFWDLTVGGIPVESNDESHNVHLLTSERVVELSEAILAQSWEELERIAESNLDMVPGWHKGLRPEFEKLRDFLVGVRKRGNAVLRVSSAGVCRSNSLVSQRSEPVVRAPIIKTRPTMWPFNKKTNPEPRMMPPGEISYSQLDITENFGDNERLSPDDWISTVPLSKVTADGQASGLPPTDASDAVVYALAERMSHIRECIPILNDGVYCPVCHIANTQLAKLRIPCPKCGRPLLKFGWD